MNYSVSSFKVYIYKVNPDSWIIRALEIMDMTLITVSSWITWRGFIAIRYIGTNSIGYANSWIILRTRITPGNSCSGFITMLGQSIRTWKVIRNIFRVGGSWPPHLLSYCFLLRPANSGLFYL